MSTGHIPVSLQRRVRLRASERCEYCRIAQVGQEATFHVDHVTPQAAGGVTSLENLALACVSCSLRKGARTTAIDPATGDAVPLFHPRLHAWSDHFMADVSGEILGLTAIGRATITAIHEPGARGRDSARGTDTRSMAVTAFRCLRIGGYCLRCVGALPRGRWSANGWTADRVCSILDPQ